MGQSTNDSAARVIVVLQPTLASDDGAGVKREDALTQRQIAVNSVRPLQEGPVRFLVPITLHPLDIGHHVAEVFVFLCCKPVYRKLTDN